MAPDIETVLTERAWRDPAFAELLQREPDVALAQIGVQLPKGVSVNVRIQDPKTMYYLIPPETDPLCENEVEVINQMDLWRSGDMFCWVLPEKLKFALLDMRLQCRNRAAEPDAGE